MTDYNHPDLRNDVDMTIAALIHDIEENKGRFRADEERLKEMYRRGDWRSEGLTKRQMEDRLFKRSGEIIGFEMALSDLYSAVNIRNDWKGD